MASSLISDHHHHLFDHLLYQATSPGVTHTHVAIVPLTTLVVDRIRHLAVPAYEPYSIRSTLDRRSLSAIGKC